MVYPVDWLHSTFKNKAQTEQLLAPELENGLTTHDYSLAVDFLPGPSRYISYAYGLGIAGVAAAFGLSRRPPWSLRRTSFLSGLGCATGLLYGQFQRAKAHFEFTQKLEDPEAFVEALEGVNRRTGGLTRLGFGIRRVKPLGESMDENGEERDPARPPSWNVPDETEQAPASAVPTPAPQQQQSRPTTRWDQIRAQNGASKNSSWDSIRQSHERSRIQPNASPKTDPPPEFPGDDRAAEQARFDAMLDEERKRSSG